jgi:hypothetical protein
MQQDNAGNNKYNFSNYFMSQVKDTNFLPRTGVISRLLNHNLNVRLSAILYVISAYSFCWIFKLQQAKVIAV